MKKLVLLCLLVSFSFGETLCEYYAKQVDKDLSKISMALEDNQPKWNMKCLKLILGLLLLNVMVKLKMLQ